MKDNKLFFFILIQIKELKEITITLTGIASLDQSKRVSKLPLEKITDRNMI